MNLEQRNLLEATKRLLVKFHIETDCGKHGHWAECEAAVDAVQRIDLSYEVLGYELIWDGREERDGQR